jgi:hypothetical protein
MIASKATIVPLSEFRISKLLQGSQTLKLPLNKTTAPANRPAPHPA